MGPLDTGNYTYDSLKKKYDNFVTPSITVTIDGKVYSSREIPLLSAEIDITADGGAGGCTLVIDSQYKPDQSRWKNDFDKHVKPGVSLAVEAGYVEQKEIFYGYVDDYSFVFDGDSGPRIEVTGIDGLGFLMNLREPFYAGQKEAKPLIEDILLKSKSAGFAKKVTVGDLAAPGSLTGFKTPAVKEQTDDWTFLNLMARRYGMSLFAVDGELIFDDVVSNTKPIITLGVQNGLRNFRKRVSLGRQLGTVEVWGRDVNQKPIKGTADNVSLKSEDDPKEERKKKSAAEHVPALKKAVQREYSEFVRTEKECSLLAQNRLNEIASGMVSGEGSCIGIPELIPGRYIRIEGLDDVTDGSYFISGVKHHFDDRGYSTSFEVKGAKTK